MKHKPAELLGGTNKLIRRLRATLNAVDPDLAMKWYSSPLRQVHNSEPDPYVWLEPAGPQTIALRESDPRWNELIRAPADKASEFITECSPTNIRQLLDFVDNLLRVQRRRKVKP